MRSLSDWNSHSTSEEYKKREKDHSKRNDIIPIMMILKYDNIHIVMATFINMMNRINFCGNQKKKQRFGFDTGVLNHLENGDGRCFVFFQ